MNHPVRTFTTLLLAALCASASPFAAGHDGKLTFAPVLERVTPAVVNIQVAGNRPARHPLFNDPAFRQFFRGREVPMRGSGAGVIIDADAGYVVTNHHVIDDADEVTVTLEDRREFSAELVGSDPQTDIALLKIDADDLTALALGDSEQLAVGDFVIAIGNPYEFGHTVTSGIVSALGREGGFLSDGYEDFIQTDAAINRGNSGGPLVDLDGRLVGINSAIVTPSGGNAGLGFAVPSAIVKVVTDQIIDHGEVRRGQLGVIIDTLSPNDAEAMGLDAAGGAVVSEVLDDTAAEAAGIEPGDVIVNLDGEDVLDARDLRLRVGLAQPGRTVEIGIVRDGKRKRLRATLGSASESASVASTVGAMPMLAGAQWRNISPGHDLHGSVRGVEVTDVAANSPAWAAGLRPGDVILRVNRQPVADVDDLEEALAAAEVAGLLIQRGQRRLFTLIR